MKRHHYASDQERNIRISWAINNAVNVLATKSAGGVNMREARDLAEQFLDLFDAMNHDQNVCDSCGGLASDTQPVIGGLHPKCRTSEGYKINDLEFSRKTAGKK